MKLFKDFGDDKSISWLLNPAVRHVTGPCIEEENCNWELTTVCAFDKASTADKVAFLACMDESSSAEALPAAKSCTKSTSIAYNAVEKCYNGAEGKALLASASKIWNDQFPSRATVPHTFVDGKDTPASYSQLKGALCSAGSKAKVCGSIAGNECFA